MTTAAKKTSTIPTTLESTTMQLMGSLRRSSAYAGRSGGVLIMQTEESIERAIAAAYVAGCRAGMRSERSLAAMKSRPKTRRDRICQS